MVVVLTVVFFCSSFLALSANAEFLSLMKIIITDIHVTRMARQVERHTGKYTGVGSKTVQEGFIEETTFHSLSIILL
jgi:hypothetical protein